MNTKLVAYFSASGITAGVAEKIAKVTQADLFAIKPQIPYTDADLNWKDQSSRSSLEMKDEASRPPILGTVESMEQYDTVLIGFPIWWYVAPTIVNTFLESCDFEGKKIILFATSGSSGMGKTIEKLQPSAPDAHFVAEKRLEADISLEAVQEWIGSLEL